MFALTHLHKCYESVVFLLSSVYTVDQRDVLLWICTVEFLSFEGAGGIVPLIGKLEALCVGLFWYFS
jgi:hypothetical protein